MIIEVLESEDTLLMSCQWAQELLGYHFSYVYCGAQMMVDADGIICNVGSIIAQYLCVTALLHQVDADKCLIIYVNNTEDISKLTKTHFMY